MTCLLCKATCCAPVPTIALMGLCCAVSVCVILAQEMKYIMELSYFVQMTCMFHIYTTIFINV